MAYATPASPTTGYSSSGKESTRFQYSEGIETLYDTATDYDTALVYNGGAADVELVSKPLTGYNGSTKPTTVFTNGSKTKVSYVLQDKPDTVMVITSKPTTGHTSTSKPVTDYVINPNYSSELYNESNLSYNDIEVSYIGTISTQEKYSIKKKVSYAKDQVNVTNYTASSKPTTEYN